MQLTNAPSKLVEAFAVNGTKNTIPVPSQIPITPGAASYNDGFPPLTGTPVTSGGIPPSLLDMNGALFGISAPIVWACAGAGYPYDSVFSAAIGGYPKGSRVLAATGVGYWFSTTDNNVTDPDTGGAGWSLQGVTALSSVYANASQTIATGTTKVLFNTVEFDQGLWDATNKRFLAPYAGKYRVTGAVSLLAPSGQNLSTEIFHSGTLAKICFQAPQVSTGNLTLCFDAIINCAIGDYIEVFMGVPTASVTAAGGSSVVFAQCTFLGT